MIVKINNQIINKVKKGATFNERIDEQLSSGLLVIFNNSKEAYDPLSLVEFFISGGETPDKYFIVDNDDSVLIKKDIPTIYQHTITLLDPLKMLEKIMVDNLAFTQPKDKTKTRYTLKQVLERIENTTPTRMAAAIESGRLFIFDESLKTEWQNITAPEFYFNDQNLLEILINIFRYKNSFPKIIGFNNGLPVISKINLNETIARVELPTAINEGVNKNNEYYLGSMQIKLENALPDTKTTFPPTPNLTIMTTPSYVMDTDSLEIVVPTPIYKVEKIVMVVDLVFASFTAAQRDIAYKEIDLTHLLYEEQEYNVLDLADKEKALVYKKGDRIIKNFGNSFPILFGLVMNNNFTEVLTNIRNNTYVTMPDAEVRRYTIRDEFKNERTQGDGGDALRGYYGFRVEYYPMANMKVNVIKQNPKTDTRYASLTNQGSPSTSVSRLMDNMQGVADRLGNADEIREFYNKEWLTRIKPQNRTTDGRYITSAEYQIGEIRHRSKIVMSENYSKLSQFVGVDREIRQYEIKFDQAIERNLLYNQFIILDTTDAASNYMFKTNSFRDMLKSIFSASYLFSLAQTIGGGIIHTYDKDQNTIGRFLMSLTKAAHKNSNVFYMNFESPTIAYKYPADNVTKKEKSALSRLITTLLNRYYTYYDTDNLDNQNNGTMLFMDVALLPKSFIKSVDNFVINVQDTDEMRNHYAGVADSYPAGLIYKVADGFIDVMSGLQWIYVLKRDINDSISEMGLTESSALQILLYNMSYTTEGDYTGDANGTVPSATSMPLWMENHYPLIKRQREIKMHQKANSPGYVDFFISDYEQIYLNRLLVYKDPTETISMTYQLHYLGGNENILIGEFLAMRSPYFQSRNSIPLGSNERILYLYRSAERYDIGESHTRGSRNGTILQAFKDITTGNTTGGFYVECPSSYPNGYNSWAVGDYNGNLYFAVNRDPKTDALPTKIYFNYKDKI